MLTNLFPPVVSGSATQSFGLSRELVKVGLKVVVITTRLDPDTPEHEVVDGVDIYRIPALRLPKMAISLNFPWLNATFWPANLRRIQAILERHEVDVLHVHNHMFDLAFAAVVMKKRLGLPMVLTLHTVIKHTNRFFNFFLSFFDLFLLKKTVIENADLIICPDENVREYLESRFKSDKGSITPYGIDKPSVPDQETLDRLRKEHRLEGARVILSLGHLHALRDRRDLIHSLPKIVEKHADVVLVIVGNVMTSAPRKWVKALGIEDNVRFVGHQPHDLIPAFFALAEMECHWLNQDDPSKTSLGIASMEAMRFGKTIIGAVNLNTFGAGHLESGRNLIIVEPGDPDRLSDHICRLLDDPVLCETIAGAAMETAGRLFSWSSVARDTASHYDQLISKGKVKNS